MSAGFFDFMVSLISTLLALSGTWLCAGLPRSVRGPSACACAPDHTEYMASIWGDAAILGVSIDVDQSVKKTNFAK